MSAGHDHSHAPANFNAAFGIGIALNIAFVAIEAFYGWKINSLALLADAGHNLSDVIGLVLAWGGALAGRLRHVNRITLGAALAIVAVTVVASSFVLGLYSLIDSTRLQARVLAENAGAALMFQDAKSAQELMQPLRNLPQLDEAKDWLRVYGMDLYRYGVTAVRA